MSQKSNHDLKENYSYVHVVTLVLRYQGQKQLIFVVAQRLARNFEDRFENHV